ncbi:hypothetical protein Dimus_033583 [Dionaea muscipula]
MEIDSHGAAGGSSIAMEATHEAELGQLICGGLPHEERGGACPPWPTIYTAADHRTQPSRRPAVDHQTPADLFLPAHPADHHATIAAAKEPPYTTASVSPPVQDSPPLANQYQPATMVKTATTCRLGAGDQSQRCLGSAFIIIIERRQIWERR